MTKKIALFDMDDTLCDYSGQLMKDLGKVYSPSELKDIQLYNSRIPREIRNQIKKIRGQEGWWRNLPFSGEGMEIWQYMLSLGFENYIATKGPYKDANAWKEKREWQKIFLPEAKGLIITDDKSLIRGDVLVDDWPPYVAKWLDVNKNGVAIMPVKAYNLKFKHDRAIFYLGTDLGGIDGLLSKHDLL